MSPNPDRQLLLGELRAAFTRITSGRVNAALAQEHSLLMEEVHLSSLDLLELSYELGELWGVQLSELDAISLRTVGDVVDLIQARAGN